MQATVRTAFACLMLLTPSVARAGDVGAILFGDVAAMRGGAVRAMIQDGSGTGYDPGGLASLDRDAFVYLEGSDRDRSSIRVPSGARAN